MPQTYRVTRHQAFWSHRNNPDVIEDIAVRIQRSPAGTAWRWRTELFILAVIGTGIWRLTYLTNLPVSALIFGIDLIGFALLPWTRRRFWCVLARHRVQKLCYEARLHTRAGRLPLIVWARPTKVGERLHLLCRAGICAEDFDTHLGRLRAACYARDARITRHPRWSQLITIDIIRRDTLAAHHSVTSPLRAHRQPPGQQPTPEPAAPGHP